MKVRVMAVTVTDFMEQTGLSCQFEIQGRLKDVDAEKYGASIECDEV